MRVRAAMGFAGICALALCCAELAGVKDVVFLDAGAGTDAAADVDTCPHVFVPSSEGGAPGTVTFLDAVQSLDVEPDASVMANLGFDLDGVCTCNGGGRSCAPLGDASICDLSGGRDIAFNETLGPLLETFLQIEPSGDINARIAAGKLTFFIEVERYSGEPNESGLIVGFYDSSGHPAFDDAGNVLPNPSPPAWDGGDVWALDCAMSESPCPDAAVLDGGFGPTFFDPHAYVTNGTLVAHFDSIVVGIGITTFRLTAPTLVAQIQPVGDGYGLTGQISGRISIEDIFSALAILPAPGGGFLCGDAGEFLSFKSLICSTADIHADPSHDNVAGEPCDALSFSLPFVALPAKIGYRFDRTPLVPGCTTLDTCTP